MKTGRPVAAAIFLATVTSRASVGIADDVDRVVARFRADAVVHVLRPRFYAGGTVTPLPLPPEASDDHVRGCTTIAVFGALSTSFALRLATSRDDDFFPSAAGAAEISMCGAERASLADLSIEMRSPRAVIETVVALSSAPLPSIRNLLPHRDLGAVPPPVDPGPLPLPAPLSDRADAVERAFRDAGGIEVERRLVDSDRTGGGRFLLDLAPGCHHIAALAVATKDDSSRDIDAELDWTSGDTAAADRTDSPDATLFACTARHTFAMLSFAGSAPKAPVLVIRARQELPVGLPERWGPAPRARMAKALDQLNVHSLSGSPVFESLGAGFIDRIRIETVPGECYLAGLAPLEDGVRFASLQATAGAASAISHTDDTSLAAVVAFCVGAEEHASLDVDVRGDGVPSWVLGMWAAGRTRLGEVVP